MSDQFQYPKTSTPVLLPDQSTQPGSWRGVFPPRVDTARPAALGHQITASWLAIFPTMLAAHVHAADQVLDVDAMTPY
jgi:hypothetical protein